MATLSTSFQNIARAVSGYADQNYTDAVRIAGTELIGTDARINANDEDFYGSIRWDNTLGPLDYTTVQTTTNTHINLATQTSAEGLVTDMSTDISEYIKTYRTHGANEYLVTQVITGRDGAIAKVGRDFGNTRARDADASIVSVLKGVIAAELAIAVANSNKLQTSADSLDDLNGFAVDLGATELIDTSLAGGKSAKGLWEALAFAYSDVEPEFVYLVVQPSVFIDMRTANLLDDTDSITDGNIQFDTLLQGKIRLLVSRTSYGDNSSSTAVATLSKKTSLVILPGAISMTDVAVPNPVAFDRDESVGRGAGSSEAWYRWGNVYAPFGYTWAGSKTAFASNANFEAAASWTRKESVGNLRILPIFHK